MHHFHVFANLGQCFASELASKAGKYSSSIIFSKTNKASDGNHGKVWKGIDKVEWSGVIMRQTDASKCDLTVFAFFDLFEHGRAISEVINNEFRFVDGRA